MASVVSKLIEEVTAHAQSDSLEDAREICADGTYFPINLRKIEQPTKLNIFSFTFPPYCNIFIYFVSQVALRMFLPCFLVTVFSIRAFYRFTKVFTVSVMRLM